MEDALEPLAIIEHLKIRVRWIPHTYGSLQGWRTMDAYPSQCAGLLAGLAGSSATIPGPSEGEMYLFSAADRPLPEMEPGSQ